MQRFAFRSLFPSAVNWRPLLCVAGAAAAAATVYYFSRRRNRQQRSREEAEELTVIEAPAAVCSQHEPTAPPQSPLRPPSPPPPPLRTPSNPGFSCPTAPEAVGDDAAPQRHPSAPSPPVPLAEPQPDLGSPSESAAEAAGDDPAPQSHPPVPSPPVPVPESQPDPLSPSESAAEAAGDDAAPQSHPPAPSPPVPVPESQPDPLSPSESAAEAAGNDASSPSQEWLPPHIIPVAPSSPQPQGDSASMEQSAPEASGDSASPQSRQTSCPQVPPLPPSPPHSAPELPSSTQIASEATADLTVPPEAYQVPALYTCFALKSSNFPLRLSALRQAFTLVLSKSHHAKYISIAGRVLLGGLAARNARELPAFQEAYARLVAFAQDASHHEAICTELAQVGIQHFNLLDIVFELVLMGVLQGARPPICPTPGGFLGHLVDMICSFSPVSMQRRPRADKYLFLLLDEAMLLLEEIFGREEHVYMDPGSLALTLWDCLEKHVQQLLARLQGV